MPQPARPVCGRWPLSGHRPHTGRAGFGVFFLFVYIFLLFSIFLSYGHKILLGYAISLVSVLTEWFRVVFVGSEKKNEIDHFREAVTSSKFNIFR